MTEDDMTEGDALHDIALAQAAEEVDVIALLQLAEEETRLDDLAALLEEAPTLAAEAFIPTDAAGVDWVLGKIAAARAEAKLIRENAELMARDEERKAEYLEFKFGPTLQAWLRAELAGSTKKSKRLFHGVLGFRTKPASVAVMDDAAALSWAQENLPAAVRQSLDRKALTEALLATGEATPFARLVPEEETFYIKS